MYEDQTYETILQRMLDKVPNTVDKREGSIIYDALAPAAVELQNMYIALDVILNESFADTQSIDYLVKRAAERGIIRKAATYTVLKGEFNIDIPLNSRFSLDELNYVAIEKISTGVYKMQCETVGIIGNTQLGTLIPIDYINGLETAALTEILIPGEDAEDVETLRARYFNSLDSQAYGGNIADYKEKVNALDGVGGLKVYPAWNGGGTVKLVLINSDYGLPSSTLIDTVQTAIDPTTNAGEGLGIAPIGHVVTVAGVESTTVDVTTTITYQSGYAWADVEAAVKAAIDAYFLELSKSWADNDNVIVRISQIEIRLLDIGGIVDIAHTALNGTEENLVLSADNIPVRGEVSG